MSNEFCNKQSWSSLYVRTEEKSEQHMQCTYNVTLCSVRIISVPPRLSGQPVNISREKRAVMAI